MAKNWYILHIYTGYEKKVSGEIARLLENEELNSSIVTSVKIPEKKIEEEKNGKKHTRTDKFLPGYLMIEMDLPELDWKSTCNVIRHIKGVTGFVGTNANTRPRPISQEEARNLFQEMGEIKSDKGTRARLSFSAGDQVKITEGPFASFEGVIDEANAEKRQTSCYCSDFWTLDTCGCKLFASCQEKLNKLKIRSALCRKYRFAGNCNLMPVFGRNA